MLPPPKASAPPRTCTKHTSKLLLLRPLPAAQASQGLASRRRASAHHAGRRRLLANVVLHPVASFLAVEPKCTTIRLLLHAWAKLRRRKEAQAP